VNYFVSRFSQKMRKQVRYVPERLMETLTNCSWEGNVRQLANFIERAVILSRSEELEAPSGEVLPSYCRNASVPASTFHEAERTVIIDALKAASGRIAGNGGAADRLGLKRTTLQHKIRRLGITKAQYLQ